MTLERCDAWHDGHTCDAGPSCRRALLALLERVDDRPRLERERFGSRAEHVEPIWPDGPWGALPDDRMPPR